MTSPAPIFVKPAHHIIVNGERLVLSHIPEAGKSPPLDEVGAGEQCENCGRTAVECLDYDPALAAFICCECGTVYEVKPGGYTEDDCEGHPAGPYDPMGQTVYCDGSCRRMHR